jgi:hypothetical protein
MTDCDTHLRYGFGVHMLLIAAVTLGYVGGVLPLRALATTAAVLPLALVGALFPDLDHHSALPYRYGKRFLPPTLGVVALLVGVHYRVLIAVALSGSSAPSLGRFLSGVVVASLSGATWVASALLFPVLRPPHRTITHRVPTGIVAALCVGGIVSLLLGGRGPILAAERVFIIGTSGAFLTGFISHLAADGVLRD